MIVTAQECVDQALKLIGVLGDGTTITPQEYTDSLFILNSMLDRWNLSDVLVFTTNPHTFPLIMGQQSYNLGPLGDFDMPRPAVISRMSIQYPSTGGLFLEIPIDSEFDLEHWQAIVVKNIPSAFPLVCYNNTGYPFMNLNFWPIPSAPCNVILYTQDLLPFIVALTDTLQLPTGYSDAIIYNLAVRLAQMFDRVPSQELKQEAAMAKHDLNAINRSTPQAKYDPMWSLGRGGNLATQSIGRVVL